MVHGPKVGENTLRSVVVVGGGFLLEVLVVGVATVEGWVVVIIEKSMDVFSDLDEEEKVLGKLSVELIDLSSSSTLCFKSFGNRKKVK